MTRREVGRRVRRSLALVLLLLPGCGTMGLDLAELPSDPIAVTYWDPEDARRRAELQEQEEQQQQDQYQNQKEGVARVEALAKLLGKAGEHASVSRYPGHLAFVDPRTGKVTLVAQVPKGAVPLAWSQDRRRLLFLSSHRGGLHLYEYDRDKDEVRALTGGRQAYMWGDLGRGSEWAQLEVVSEGSRQFERVNLVDGVTGPPRMLFEDRGAETFRLAPDGSMLVYVRRAPPGPGGTERPSELVKLDLATGEEHDLGPGREPSFSPTGDWIVYSAPSRAGWRLRRMRPDGSARSPVSAGIRDEKMPSVSPDGQFVVYVGETTGLDRLFVRRIDGTGDRILLDEGAFFAPVW